MKNPGLVVFLILLAVGGFGMATTGASVYVRIFYMSVLLVVGSSLWTLVSLRGLRVNRQARSLRASVGDIFEETFEIYNTSRVPRLWLEVLNRSDLPMASGSRILTWIGAVGVAVNAAAERLQRAVARRMGAA